MGFSKRFRQVEQDFSSFFAAFLAHLIFFQSEVHYETLQNHQIDIPKIWQKMKKALLLNVP